MGDGTKHTDGEFWRVVAHFSKEIRIYPFFRIHSPNAKVNRQALHFRNFVLLADDLCGVVVIDGYAIEARINAAIPYIERVAHTEVLVLIRQCDEDAVGGVSDDKHGVGDGNGVRLPDNTCHRVSRPYQRHRVDGMDADGVSWWWRCFRATPSLTSGNE